MKEYIKKYYAGLYESGSRAAAPIARGRSLAAELGYPRVLIEALPDEIWEDFLPCGNVLSLMHLIDPKPGELVLNLGCGVGIDSFGLGMPCDAGRAAQEYAAAPPFPRTGFRVVGLDTASSALARASGLAKRLFPDSDFHFICGDGGALPFGAGLFDSIILNGVFNLFPDKSEITGEMHRVLKVGGIVAGADLCRRIVLPDYFASEPDAWAWCMSGALSERELRAAFEASGFKAIELNSEEIDDYFDRTLFVFENLP